LCAGYVKKLSTNFDEMLLKAARATDVRGPPPPP